MFAPSAAPAQAPAPVQTNWFSSFLPTSKPAPDTIPVNDQVQANTKAETMVNLLKNVGYIGSKVYYPIIYDRLFGIRGMKSYKSDLEKLFFMG